jgi:hypothetical protein
MTRRLSFHPVNEGKQLVAIRVTRPYSSEEEFLEHEIETLTRTSVMLVGAQSRPQGVILRFEVAMLNGTPLMRGEGRVIGFKANAMGELPGLTLRFTRLDKKTKALVDKAALIREARSRAAFEASMGESDPPPSMPPASLGPTSLGPASLGPASAPSISSLPSLPSVPSVSSVPAPSSAPQSRPPPRSSAPPSARPASARPPSARPPSVRPPAPVVRPQTRPQVARIDASPQRDELLGRLRERARALSPSTINRIFQDAKEHRKRTPSA